MTALAFGGEQVEVQTPLSLIESWLKIEADRGVSQTWGPDSVSPPMGDSKIHQADELRAWWIVHCAFARMCAPQEPQILKSLVIHVHFYGRTIDRFWLQGMGVTGWQKVLRRFYEIVHEVAEVTPRDKFWEEE